MFGEVPESLFRVHDWRNDVVTIGHVPPEMVSVFVSVCLSVCPPTCKPLLIPSIQRRRRRQTHASNLPSSLLPFPSQVLAASDGKLNEPWPAQLNKLMVDGGHDLVLSVGQVVPHEVLVRE